jgi:hypothetical protein
MLPGAFPTCHSVRSAAPMMAHYHKTRRGGTAIHSGALGRVLSTGAVASTWPR